jgi:hypothetical protein
VKEARIQPWRPFKGKKFSETKVLILSESAYSWHDDGGNLVIPSSSHPSGSLNYWGIKHFCEQKYFTAMGRALCGKKTPTTAELKRVWNEYAYSIYVQGTVGLGAGSKATPKNFRDSGYHFLRLIEKIRPLRVIVTGKGMWNQMPPCTGPHRGDFLQAYMLADGALVWCLAVPHPSNRREGFRWEEVGESIRNFITAKLPLRD